MLQVLPLLPQSTSTMAVIDSDDEETRFITETDASKGTMKRFKSRDKHVSEQQTIQNKTASETHRLHEKADQTEDGNKTIITPQFKPKRPQTNAYPQFIQRKPGGRKRQNSEIPLFVSKQDDAFSSNESEDHPNQNPDVQMLRIRTSGVTYVCGVRYPKSVSKSHQAHPFVCIKTRNRGAAVQGTMKEYYLSQSHVDRIHM
eukprot:276161_1